MNQFGQRLREIRKRSGLTQTELGQAVGGISKRMISYYERDGKHPPVELLKKIANVLKVSIDELVGSESVEVDGRTIDGKLLLKFKQIQSLSNSKKQALNQVIDSFLQSSK